MSPDFTFKPAKHKLFYVSISLGTIVLCMLYAHRSKNYQKLGKFWNSPILFFILVGEILKGLLAKYFIKTEERINKYKKSKIYSSFKELFKAIILQSLSTLFYASICMILGAPVLNSYEETLTLSTLLTLLTVTPLVLLRGAAGALQAIFCEKNEFLKSELIAINLASYTAVGSILGAWSGSIVSPLDWDREWQIYPIPNIIGTILGFGLINMYLCVKTLHATAGLYLNKKVH